MSKFLLLLGVSGVGKSCIIEELIRIDGRFTYISPYVTRPLRDGEKNKIHISDKEMSERCGRGEFLVVNELYGIRYATPRVPIVQALAENQFPVLDWPISRMEVMVQAFPNQLYAVYILPPSIEVLQQRLAKDGRDTDGHRLRSAIAELETYSSSAYKLCDFEIVAEENKKSEVAQAIYEKYQKSK